MERGILGSFTGKLKAKSSKDLTAQLAAKELPSDANEYELLEDIGRGVSATVHRALCKSTEEVVAVKKMNLERVSMSLEEIIHEAQTMKSYNHPNVLPLYTSFVHGQDLWMVTPFMSGGSVLHIMKYQHPEGLDEVAIATIMRYVLLGLEYVHKHGGIHRDVKAGNILIDRDGVVRIGDFGVAATVERGGSWGNDVMPRTTFVGTPCWMAPEVMEQTQGYDSSADIWSFGITMLELANGHAPFAKFPPMKVLLMTLQNPPPQLDDKQGRKHFSKSMRNLVARCLQKDPRSRPSAAELLQDRFFKQARDEEYLRHGLMAGLPALGERVQQIRVGKAATSAAENDKQLERSQEEYVKGVSSWNFDLAALRAQAASEPEDGSVPATPTFSPSALSTIVEAPEATEGDAAGSGGSSRRSTEDAAALPTAAGAAPSDSGAAAAPQQSHQAVVAGVPVSQPPQAAEQLQPLLSASLSVGGAEQQQPQQHQQQEQLLPPLPHPPPSQAGGASAPRRPASAFAGSLAAATVAAGGAALLSDRGSVAAAGGDAGGGGAAGGGTGLPNGTAAPAVSCGGGVVTPSALLQGQHSHPAAAAEAAAGGSAMAAGSVVTVVGGAPPSTVTAAPIMIGTSAMQQQQQQQPGSPPIISREGSDAGMLCSLTGSTPDGGPLLSRGRSKGRHGRFQVYEHGEEPPPLSPPAGRGESGGLGSFTRSGPLLESTGSARPSDAASNETPRRALLGEHEAAELAAAAAGVAAAAAAANGGPPHHMPPPPMPLHLPQLPLMAAATGVGAEPEGGLTNSYAAAAANAAAAGAAHAPPSSSSVSLPLAAAAAAAAAPANSAGGGNGSSGAGVGLVGLASGTMSEGADGGSCATEPKKRGRFKIIEEEGPSAAAAAAAATGAAGTGGGSSASGRVSKTPSAADLGMRSGSGARLTVGAAAGLNAGPGLVLPELLRLHEQAVAHSTALGRLVDGVRAHCAAAAAVAAATAAAGEEQQGVAAAAAAAAAATPGSSGVLAVASLSRKLSATGSMSRSGSSKAFGALHVSGAGTTGGGSSSSGAGLLLLQADLCRTTLPALLSAHDGDATELAGVLLERGQDLERRLAETLEELTRLRLRCALTGGHPAAADVAAAGGGSSDPCAPTDSAASSRPASRRTSISAAPVAAVAAATAAASSAAGGPAPGPQPAGNGSGGGSSGGGSSERYGGGGGGLLGVAPGDAAAAAAGGAH